MSRRFWIQGSLPVLAAIAVWGCEGKEGPVGPTGPAGEKGDPGSSCTVTDNGNGTKTIACTDGTSAVVTDGARGAAGTSCSVTDNGDGTKTLSCTDNTSVVISDGQDGQDGQDGTSCSVADNGDGTKTVTCGQTIAVLSDGAKGDKGDPGEAGADGTSCSVSETVPGTKVIACTDGTSVTVTDGAKGDKGDKGDPGPQGPVGPSAAFVFHVQAEVPNTLLITVTEPPVIASPPVVKFTVKDAVGRGAVGLKAGSSGFLRFGLFKLAPAANGEPADWVSYVLSSSGTPTVERTGTLVDNGDGSYVYTFATNVTNVTTPKAVAWEPTLTHRLVIQLSGTTAAGTLPYGNGVYDFVPAGGQVTQTHNVAATADCNTCHGKLVVHGSRYEVGYCATCHAKGVVDPNGVDIDMATMTHAIHAAHLRHQQGASPYRIKSSYSGNTYDFSEVTYPGPLNACRKCHEGTRTQDGDNWKKFPTKEACGSCHATVDWAAHMGGQADNSACKMCHTENGITNAHKGENNTPNATGVVAGASVFTYDIKSVTMADATHPQITFRITRDGNPMDVTTLPSDLTGGPSFLLVWAAPEPGQDPATFQPVDWNNFPRAAAQPLSVSLANLRSGAAGTLAPDAANPGYYIATLTGSNAFPADAKMRAVALQGYFSQTGVPGYSAALGRHTLSVVKEVTGDAKRREVIDSQKCGACHEWFEGHGGNRVAGLGSTGANICATCHVPNLTTSGRGADPATVIARLQTAGANTPLIWDLNANGACDPEEDAYVDGTCDVLDGMVLAGYDPADPLTFPEVTNNLKEMLHAIHGAAIRTGAFREVRDRGTSGVFYYDFSHVTYPNNKDACLACHKTGTYLTVPEGASATTWRTSNGIDDRTNILAARTTVPNAQDTVATPYASACYSCHDSAMAKAHMEQNGGQIGVDRQSMTNPPLETCALCHGAGRAADVKVAHGL
ncbi:OmcA/MtrC family decaheme c-type cytochrome [Myxococcota bacterium]|nr:OmcA/MtrC family decaheme c-type cytochrome [Myxococcota bacterium]